MSDARDAALAHAARLLRRHRWGALATLEPDGTPYASSVAFVVEADFSGVLLHLSSLAPHTRNLLQRPAVSLLVSETDAGDGDPQTLPRLSLLGDITAIARDSADYAPARQTYLRRLPSAEPLFEFGDFRLFRLVPREARFVGGFASARRFDASALRQAARSEGPGKDQG
jgi:putative heme iron utilization protein